MPVRELPQMLQYKIEDSGGYFGGMNKEPIDEGICNAFEKLEKACDYAHFFEWYNVFPSEASKYRSVWGLNAEFEAQTPTLDDYISVRDVLFLAIRLRHISTGKATVQDLIEVGGDYLEIEEFSDGSLLVRLRIPIEGQAYARELTRVLQDYEDSFEPPFTLEKKITHSRFETSRLRMTLRDGVPTLELSPIVRDEDRGFIHCPNEDGFAAVICASEISHLLFAAHLRGIETTEYLGTAVQVTDSGLSALWLAYLNGMTKSRIDVCKVCHKPIVISGERGRRREYCSPACRTWAHQNPGQTRAMRFRQKKSR